MSLNKNLKYVMIIGFLLSFSILFMSFNNPKQITDIDDSSQLLDDPEQVVYWFYTSVRIDDRTNSYKVNGTPGGIQWGYIEEFEKDLWGSLSRRKIAIGPFFDKNTAINARRLYKSKPSRITTLPKDTVPDIVYWFAISFDKSDRLGIFVIERVPGAVQNGSEQFFIDAFFQQLVYKQFAVGPFYQHAMAEEAKRLYRKNE